MISSLSINEQKEKHQKDQFFKKTQIFTENSSSQSNLSQYIPNLLQQRNSKTFNIPYTSPKSISVDKKLNCQVVEMNPNKLDFFNRSRQTSQRNSNPTKKITEKIQCVHDININKSQISQLSNNQSSQVIQMNIVNSSDQQQRKHSAELQILSQDGKNLNMLSNYKKQQIMKTPTHNNEKQNQFFSNRARTHQNRTIIKNLDSPRQIASKLKDQAMVEEARNYNLSRQQSLIMKRNNYILQHEVKDYIEILDDKFQQIQQKQGIQEKDKTGNEQNSQFYPLNRKSISRDRIQSVSPIASLLLESTSNEGKVQDQNQIRQTINSSRTQTEVKSYDQIYEDVNKGVIQKSLLNKEDIYKSWNQSNLIVDHIKQYIRNPSQSCQQQIKYTPYVPIDQLISPKSQKSKSISSNTTFTMVSQPQSLNSNSQNNQQKEQNLSNLVKETWNQLEKMKQLQRFSVSQQNQSSYKSVDFTQSTQASPIFNYQIPLNNLNNGLESDIINEQNLVLNTEFTPIVQSYLSPKSSPRRRNNLIKREKTWSTKSSMFQNIRKDIAIELQKIQPHLKSENQDTQNTTKQLTTVQFNQDYEQPYQSFELIPGDNMGFQTKQQIEKQNKFQPQIQSDKTIDEGDDSSKSKLKIHNKNFSNQSLRSICSREDISLEQTPKRNIQRQKQKIKHSGSMSSLPSSESLNSSQLQNITRIKSKMGNYKNTSNFKKKQNAQDTKRLNYLDEIQKRKQFKVQQELIQRKLNRKNLLSKDEIMIYADTRKKYFEDLKDEFEAVKMNYGLNTEQFQDDWGILLQKTNYDIYDSLNSLPEEEKNYNIKQTYICMEEEGLYRKVQEINLMLKQCHKTVARKFVRYVKQNQEADLLSERRKYANRLTQFEVCQNKMTLDELNLFVDELKISPHNRNYETLYIIVKKLWFFKKYSLSVTRQIINIGSVICVPKNAIIFNEGDIGDKMYVILKGSVHVRVNRQSTDPEIPVHNPVVITLYDGYQFGDLALINKSIKSSKDTIDLGKILTLKQMRQQILSSQVIQKDNITSIISKKQSQISAQFPNSQNNLQRLQIKVKAQTEQKKNHKQKLQNVFQDAAKNNNKRSATIEAAEETYLLTISRENFSSILLNLIMTEMQGKLELLKKIPFLAVIIHQIKHNLYGGIRIYIFFQNQFYKFQQILNSYLIVKDFKYFLILQQQKYIYKFIYKHKNINQKELEYANLITLASYIEIKQFTLGDIILREGEDPKYFYIVSKGRCEIVKEEIIIRSRNFIDGKKTKSDQKPFKFGQAESNNLKILNLSNKVKYFIKVKSDNKSVFQEDEEKIQNKFNHDYFTVINEDYLKNQIKANKKDEDEFDYKSLNSSLEFEFYGKAEGEEIQPLEQELNKEDQFRNYKEQSKNKSELQQIIQNEIDEKDVRMFNQLFKDKDHLAFCYFHNFGAMQEGDIFMIRSFLSEQSKVDSTIREEIDYDPFEKARMTVISETSKTEIAMIDKAHIHLVAPHLKRLIIDNLTSMKDYDHCFDNKKNQWIERWDNIKMRIFKDQKQYNKQQK